MKNRQHPESEERRSFLRKAAAGGGATAVITALPSAAIAGPEEPEQADSQKGYRLTQHVLDYYKSVSE